MIFYYSLNVQMEVVDLLTARFSKGNGLVGIVINRGIMPLLYGLTTIGVHLEISATTPILSIVSSDITLREALICCLCLFLM